MKTADRGHHGGLDHCHSGHMDDRPSRRRSPRYVFLSRLGLVRHFRARRQPHLVISVFPTKARRQLKVVALFQMYVGGLGRQNEAKCSLVVELIFIGFIGSSAA